MRRQYEFSLYICVTKLTYRESAYHGHWGDLAILLFFLVITSNPEKKQKT